MMSLESNPLVLLPFLLSVGLFPLALLMVSSFVKLSVVFGILRNALGLGQIPPTSVTTMLALVLSIYVMSPVMRSTASIFESRLAEIEGGDKAGIKIVERKNIEQKLDFKIVLSVLSDCKAPIQQFLVKHSDLKERIFFAAAAERPNTATAPVDSSVLLEKETLFSLIPAFLITELRESFAVGFAIFLPFLVIDLVVSNVLLGLGMMMMSPVTIALPLKVFLFVLVDGWFLLCKSLVQSYFV